MNLPKPILHIRLPYALSEDKEDVTRHDLEASAKDYFVLLTCDSESGRIEMEVHWILPKELSEEKANEIIETLNSLK